MDKLTNLLILLALSDQLLTTGTVWAVQTFGIVHRAEEMVGFIEEGQAYGQFRDIDAALYASVVMPGMRSGERHFNEVDGS